MTGADAQALDEAQAVDDTRALDEARALDDPAVIDGARIAHDLAALGLPRGRSVLVHCSMSAIGHVTGGAATVLSAIQHVIGCQATVVVPAQTPNNSTTSPAFRVATRGMSAAELAEFEEHIPAFDPATSPSCGMGALAEHVRCSPGAVRSAHPQASFAALGPDAAALMAVHDLSCHLGEQSPVASLDAAGATVLLLGVGYEACTALHLAEYRLPWPAPERWHRCYVYRDGKRVRRDFRAAHLDAGSFEDLGVHLDRQRFTKIGMVGRAQARVLPISAAVSCAIRWMAHHRRP